MCLPGLHITQGIFQKIFSLLEEACHELDLKLACHFSSSIQHGSYSEYVRKMRELTSTRAALDTAKQAVSGVEQLVVYLSITLDQTNPLLQGMLHHQAECRKEVEKLVSFYSQYPRTELIMQLHVYAGKYGQDFGRSNQEGFHHE